MDDLDAGRVGEPFIYSGTNLMAVSWSRGNVTVDVHFWPDKENPAPGGLQVLIIPISTGNRDTDDARHLRDFLDCAIWLAEQWQREIDEAGE